ncbi:MAG TPA: hypothetical protein VGK99_03515 [Acidobacteriota bacterium]
MKSSILCFLWTTLLVCQVAGPAHAATVKLAWDPNTEPDLAGYNVYRSQTSGSGYSRLNGGLVLTPSYNDAAAGSGQTYFYVVTAVNALASESGFSNEVTAVVGFPDLAISKTHAGSFPVGANGLYTVTVSNVGSAASSGTITVTDTLPIGLSFISGSGTGWSFAASGQTVTCLNTGSVAAGASSVFTLTVGVGSAAFPAVTNIAAISNLSDLNPANNNASDPTTVTQPPLTPDLAISKSHSGSFRVGTNGVYTLTVTNVGSAASSGTITVTDNLPAGLSFVSGAGTGWICAAAGQVVTCTNTGSIAAGANRVITLTVSVGAAAFPSITNVATVSNSSDLNSANNNASDPTIVTQATYFYTLTPCRVLDTRNPNGPFGGPALVAGATRTFTISGRCAIPSTAKAVSINITVTAATVDGHLRLYPGGTPLPLVSSINYPAGRTRANNGIITLGALGDIAVRSFQPSGTAHLIIDVNGYFQ